MFEGPQTFVCDKIYPGASAQSYSVALTMSYYSQLSKRHARGALKTNKKHTHLMKFNNLNLLKKPVM